jgi:hypothetical protein
MIADEAREALTSAIYDAINFAGMTAADIALAAASIQAQIVLDAIEEERGNDDDDADSPG